MKEQINEKLNEAFNKYAGMDCPMWCGLVPGNGEAYLTWHKYQDRDISLDVFRACAIVIYAEFKDITNVVCPWWGLSRESLKKSSYAAIIRLAI